MKHRKMYGKIFKSRFGPQLVVSIADRDMVAEVLRAEGVAPQRANMESWKEYRDMRSRSTGLISAWDYFFIVYLFILSGQECTGIVMCADMLLFPNSFKSVVRTCHYSPGFLFFQWRRRLAEDAKRAQTAHHASTGRSGLLWWRKQSCRWPGEEN